MGKYRMVDFRRHYTKAIYKGNFGRSVENALNHGKIVGRKPDLLIQVTWVRFSTQAKHLPGKNSGNPHEYFW